MNLEHHNLFLAVELSRLAFYTQRQFLDVCCFFFHYFMFFQKCQRHFISLCKFLYFSTETTCPIFMDLRPLFLQMFDSGSKPWMVGLAAGWSRLREIRRDYVSVCVCVCECIRERNLYVCLCVRSCMRSFSGAVAEECIVLSAVRPHKHGTREEKHISPSWETPGKKKIKHTACTQCTTPDQ